MTLPFLITKTHIPNPTSNLVARPRLYEIFNQLLNPGCQVALVSAPAGYGKTTLLTQWLQRLPDSFKVGWFSLDESDNSPFHFFSYIAAALQNADPAISENFSTLIETQAELTADKVVSYLINQVAASQQNILLVLDDTHVITAPEIHHAIEMLVTHIPDNLRLVLAGRVDPLLPLARLRANGQLVEVRTTDLRFNISETSGFLDQFAGLQSPVAPLVNALNHSTEGWAAGLQMTVIALRSELQMQGGKPGEVLNRLVNELSGTHHYILDYLLNEVLNREEPQVREFLLRTCLLERFNANLCAALCAEDTDTIEAQSMLESLERANLFIIPLDNQREWYRYHHLFADVLQKQLLHTYPGLAPDLHRCAADWFERQGMIDNAIAHAHWSGDAVLLRSLVEKFALETIMHGQFATAISWLNGLPADMLMSSPRLCLDRAWVMTFTFQTETAATYLERAEFLLRDMPNEALLVRSEVFGLQSYCENMYGHPEEAIRLAKLALENAPPDNLFLQCCNHLFLAGAFVHAGKAEEAVREYHTIQPACRDRKRMAGLALLEADFLHDLAVFLHAAGEANRAKAMLEQAIRDFEAEELQPAALYLHVGLGKLLFNENDLDGSELSLETGLQFDPLSLSIGAFDGRLALWRVKIGKGDRVAARNILEKLERAARGCDKKVIHMVVVAAALQDLIENNVAVAARRLEQLGLTGDVDVVLEHVSDSELSTWRHNEFYTYTRLLIAQKKTKAALKVLKRLENSARAVQMDYLASRAQVLKAVVHFQDGSVDLAMQVMTPLLERTATMESNVSRIYLAAGEPGRSLLKEAARQGIQSEHVTSLLAVFPTPVQPEPIPDLPDALSEREVEVLRLMADGLKNQEIADRLVVSLNTIRYHSKNIFGKLGVDNRTAAVGRARELGLLT